MDVPLQGKVYYYCFASSVHDKCTNNLIIINYLILDVESLHGPCLRLEVVNYGSYD